MKKAVDLTSTPHHKSLHNLDSTHDSHHVTDLSPITPAHTSWQSRCKSLHRSILHSHTHRSLPFPPPLFFAAVRVRVHRGNTNPGASERVGVWWPGLCRCLLRTAAGRCACIQPLLVFWCLWWWWWWCGRCDVVSLGFGGCMWIWNPYAWFGGVVSR